MDLTIFWVEISLESFVINTVVREPIIIPKGNSISFDEYENKVNEPSLIVDAHDRPIVGINIRAVTKLKLNKNCFKSSFVIRPLENTPLWLLNRSKKNSWKINLAEQPINTPIVILQRIGIFINKPKIMPPLKNRVPEAPSLNLEIELK